MDQADQSSDAQILDVLTEVSNISGQRLAGRFCDNARIGHPWVFRDGVSFGVREAHKMSSECYRRLLIGDAEMIAKTGRRVGLAV